MPWRDKAAQRAYHREWRERNRERINAQVRKRRAANPDRERAANKRYYWNHREKLLAKGRALWKTDRQIHENCRLRRKYGITVQDLAILTAAQKNRCACCGRPEKTRNKAGQVAPLSIDHDHITGTVRALLCSHCNIGIGHFEDNPDLLRKAIAYLERSASCRLEA